MERPAPTPGSIAQRQGGWKLIVCQAPVSDVSVKALSLATGHAKHEIVL